MKLKPEELQQAPNFLKTLPLFHGCSDAHVQLMASSLDAREVGPGKVVMMDQEINRSLYILAKGTVGIWKRIGGEKKQLASFEAPNFFGERSMFEESPASAFVKTDGTCLLYVLERTQFDAVVAKFPDIVETIRKNMEIVRAQRMGPATPAKEGGDN